MKKLFSLLILVGLSVGIFAAGADLRANSKPAPKNLMTRIEAETKDGMLLVGDFYPSRAAGKMPLVILLHSFGGKSNDWGELPKKIVEGGNNVLTIDARGHGRSIYTSKLAFKPFKHFTTETWQKLPNDVLEVISFMKDNYSKVDYSQIILVGADLGANTAVLAGDKMKPKPQKMVLISPAQNFKNLYIPIIISNYDDVPMMLMVSESDKYFLQQANVLSKFIQSAHSLKIYKQGGTGTILLKRNPDACDVIVNFIYSRK